MPIRAKFKVAEAGAIYQRVMPNPTEKWEPGKTVVKQVHEKVLLTGVYATGSPKAENVSYAKSTPQGKIELTIDNEQAWGLLIPGDEFYVTFERAPFACSKCYGQGKTWNPEAPCDRCKETGIDPEQPATR